jgi:hypothetical protein
MLSSRSQLVFQTDRNTFLADRSSYTAIAGAPCRSARTEAQAGKNFTFSANSKSLAFAKPWKRLSRENHPCVKDVLKN